MANYSEYMSYIYIYIYEFLHKKWMAGYVRYLKNYHYNPNPKNGDVNVVK